jgi:hypothetical protein
LWHSAPRGENREKEVMSFDRKVPWTLLGIAASVILLLCFPRCGMAGAQKSKITQEPGGSLVVGTVAGERGTTAAIPLYYEPAKNSRLRSLHLELDFVSNSIQFTQAEKGVAAQIQDFDLAVEAREFPPDDKKISRTRLTIDVSLDGAGSQISLPAGLLSFLNFRIPEDAKPFSISLNPVTVSAQDAAKKPVEVTAEAGKVIVSIPDAPLAGCFFFSH